MGFINKFVKDKKFIYAYEKGIFFKEEEKLLKSNMNICFVGAGVSTIFSIIHLLKNGYPGKNITVLDKGKDIEDRPENEYIFGFGGAGFKSDGKIIYSTIQGGELSKYTGEEKAKDLLNILKKHVKDFHPDPTKIISSGINKIPDFIHNSNFDLNQSECQHIGTDYLKIWNQNVREYFRENEVNFLFDTEVVDIDFSEKEIKTKDNNTHKFDKIILAVGKSGTKFLTNLINKYNLQTSPKATQIGVRFESDYKYFKKIVDHFYDFKLTKKYKDISVRTFCCNSIAAYVAKEDVNELYSYNGHAYKDSSKENGLTNFGIMMEIPNIGNPLEYTQQLVSKCNKIGNYYTPGNRKPTLLGKKITLNEFNNLYEDKAQIILDFIQELNNMFCFEQDYVFYLPEVKYLTNEVKVKHDSLELGEYKDIYMIGDILSARGIAISACQGIYVAEGLLR